MTLRLLLLLLLSAVCTVESGDLSGAFTSSELAGKRPFTQSSVDVVQTRIIGGVDAWPHSWPWQASLKLIFRPACGGAIVSQLWVISAAHCFKRYNKASFWTVLAGKHHLDNAEENGQQVIAVSKIFAHKDYSIHTKEHDVALLKLEQMLVFNDFVRPINIWMHTLPLLSECTATGWGSTRENGPRVNILQEVNVTIVPSEVCNKYYVGRIRDTMFCAGKEKGGADACQGDSGGPLSCFNGSRYELAGLVSWGVGCGRAKKPGVYTRTQHFVPWIYDIITNEENTTLDVAPEAEDNCGKLSAATCVKAPLLAALSQPQDGTVSVQNVSECCPNQWPWQVSIQHDDRHHCSGTLIHQRFVLTAQHCHVRAEDTVVLGIHDLKISSMSQRIPIDKVINLPQDGSFPPGSDLSLLRLSMPARLGRNVAPVCVPDQDDDDDLDDSWSCVLTGWGTARSTGRPNRHRLHHVAVTLVNETICRQKWGEDIIKDSHMCVHPAASTSCLGDSGAPLFCRKHGAYFLFGVVTWGSSRCDEDLPAVFTRVPQFYSWITKETDLNV